MPNHEKSLGALLSETKEELKEFFETRIQILIAEIREKVTTWKYAIPLLLVAIAILLTAWATFTFALLALFHSFFVPSYYAWLWSALIVTAVYALIGGGVGWFAYGEIMAVGVAPKRTLQVLKQDQVWIQNEARTA